MPIFVITGSSAVQSLQHVAQSDSLRVTWQPPAHRRGIITGYKLSYKLRQRGTCPRLNGQWSGAKRVTSPYVLTRLDPYSEYSVRVVPVNGAGDGVEATMDWRTTATGKPSLIIIRFIITSCLNHSIILFTCKPNQFVYLMVGLYVLSQRPLATLRTSALM